MKLKRPSPAMVVAVVALVMSTTGGALAAVNFAKNAGAVDGRSAVGPGAGNDRAAGKLVATDRSGRFPSRFVDAARTAGGAVLIATPDDGLSEPERVVDLELGSLSAACFDQRSKAGVENPATRFYVTNHSGGPLNVAHRAGRGRGSSRVLPAGGAVSFVVGSQAPIEVQLQNADRSVVVHGAARQAGRGSANGSCGAFATALFADGTG